MSSELAEEITIPGVTGVQLVINSYGTSVRRRGDCFQLKRKDTKREIAASRIDSVLITTGAHMSTDAIELASEHNIGVVLVDGIGRPYARLWHPNYGSTAEIRRKQLMAVQKPVSLEITLDLLSRKLQGRLDFLSDLMRARPDEKNAFQQSIKQIGENMEQLESIDAPSVDECRSSIMALEGSAGRTYFGMLSETVPQKYQFHTRSPRDYEDPVNSFLNYAYGVLYTRVESACLLAGLDPHVGLLHTDRYNKPSMVCDLIEPFRVYAERPIIYLFTRRRVKPQHYERKDDSPRLTEDGRRLLLEDLNDHLEESIRYRGRNVQRLNVIQAEAHRIANRMLKEVE